jgi:hypothetical protein
MTTESRIDPAKLRVVGRDLLAQLDARHEVISNLQQVVDDTWRQAYDIEARIKAILVHLGLTSASEPFDENAATLALREATPDA